MAVNWLAHHRLFMQVEDYDSPLIWLNFLFLFAVVVLPFPTEWLELDSPKDGYATFYLLTLAVVSGSLFLMSVHLRRTPGPAPPGCAPAPRAGPDLTGRPLRGDLPRPRPRLGEVAQRGHVGAAGIAPGQQAEFHPGRGIVLGLHPIERDFPMAHDLDPTTQQPPVPYPEDDLVPGMSTVLVETRPDRPAIDRFDVVLRGSTSATRWTTT